MQSGAVMRFESQKRPPLNHRGVSLESQTLRALFSRCASSSSVVHSGPASGYAKCRWRRA